MFLFAFTLEVSRMLTISLFLYFFLVILASFFLLSHFPSFYRFFFLLSFTHFLFSSFLSSRFANFFSFHLSVFDTIFLFPIVFLSVGSCCSYGSCCIVFVLFFSLLSVSISLLFISLNPFFAFRSRWLSPSLVFFLCAFSAFNLFLIYFFWVFFVFLNLFALRVII